jgi:uncharacterized protein
MKTAVGSLRKMALIFPLVAVLFVIGLFAISGWIQDWLWMDQVGYAVVFRRIFTIKFALAAAGFLTAFFYLWLNLRMAASTVFRLRGHGGEGTPMIYTRQGIGVPLAWARAGLFLVSGIVGLAFASALYAQWDTFIRFHWGGSFGQSDPIFGRDIGFYLFRLPFYEFIRDTLTGLTFLALAAVGIAYVQFGALQPGSQAGSRAERPLLRHLALLFIPFAACWGWGFYLDRFGLLQSSRGVVYGVGYTAYHIDRIGLWVMMAAAALLTVFILHCLMTRRLHRILIAATGYFILYFLVLVLIPGLVQKYIVAPNEFKLERPFLEHNIAFTRKAFQLDRINDKAYPALGDLTLSDIDQHRATIENIRLWDWRPILQTYRQTQEIRLYYQFSSVDVDRYQLSDGIHQVMLSARELAPELPAKARTWVNQYLQFTHGYGLVMSFVSKQQEGGLPVYVLKDIPPTSDYGLKVDQPAVYYGENAPGYRIVSTNVKEFDYPKGNDNVYTSYHGKGGIPLNRLWKRLLFAWTQADMNLLFTSSLSPKSRIQIYRGVRQRVSKTAPFLALDSDPYLVLAGGRLYWIQDAYTLSDRYPYSQPSGAVHGRLDYIRNAVKAVVDVYDGTVQLYVTDPDDPILQLYRKAFPGIFKPLSELPADLKPHLRYPQDLFSIQANAYMAYHMTDPQVFYNQEDLWALPQEKYAGEAVPFQPYYILMRLPNTDRLHYFLMMPFTPQGRDNMVAWMGADCDFPGYGNIIVYQLPKERLTFGPIQIEAMIDQNALISQQLSLWDQRGSHVIRGNLVVIPIENSFLYVEPVYLLAEGVNIPQLIRVIVVSGDKVVMEPTLDKAIQAVFGAAPASGKPAVTSAAALPIEPDVLIRARKALDQATEAVQKGKWEDFGKAMDELNKTLKPQKRDGNAAGAK